MKALITGGAGYIGSHTAAEFLSAGWEVTLLDDFSNSREDMPQRLERICGRAPEVVRGSVLDGALLRRALEGCDIVVHFAGLKAVGESVAQPLKYYRVNCGGTLSLLEAMLDTGVRRLVFSSSATVYAPARREELPLTESSPLGAVNPYGRTKQMIEQMVFDLCAAQPDFSAALLRYFNPIGAHKSGLIGEEPQGVPNNLMPYITQTAAGRREYLGIFGDDYDTVDGTGVRDYIHVVDLARGHLAAADWVMRSTGAEAFNLGTGRGCSVYGLVSAFKAATGIAVPCRVQPRRPGDLPEYYGSAEKARRCLGWSAELSLEDMCADSWRWERNLAASGSV